MLDIPITLEVIGETARAIESLTQQPEMYFANQENQIYCTESEESSEAEQDKSYFDHEKLNDSFSDKDLVDTTMRDKYKLKNKLPLPQHMKHLYNLFGALDTYLNLLKRRRGGEWQVTYSDLSPMIEHSFHRNFREEHFCKILTVCPNFFIHKWEQKKGKLELFIEIPVEIIEILSGECIETKESENAFPKPLDENTLQARRAQFE